MPGAGTLFFDSQPCPSAFTKEMLPDGSLPKIAVALVAVGFISVMLLPTLIEGIVPITVLAVVLYAIYFVARGLSD